MLISVIMNCFNGECFLKQSIDSILSSNYNNFELIFFDNCSTDNSIKIAESFNDKRIKIFKNFSNVNLGEARKLAVNKSKGELICFLDVDDLICKNTLKKYVNFFNEFKYDIIYEGVEYIDANGNIINSYNPSFDTEIDISKLLKNFDVNVPSMCFHRNIFSKYKLNFDPIIKCCEEFAIITHAAVLNAKIVSVNTLFSLYRIHDSSLTHLNLNIGAIERRYILDNIKHLVKSDHQKIYNFAYFKSYYYDAIYLAKKGDLKAAKKELKKAYKYSIIFKILYWGFLISPKFCLYLYKLKGRRIIKI